MHMSEDVCKGGISGYGQSDHRKGTVCSGCLVCNLL